MALGPLLQPTKWYGHKPWPYKMVLAVSCLGSFSSTTILTFSSKDGQMCAFMFFKKYFFKKKTEPFCRASTSPGTRLKLPFSSCHFVEQNPVNRPFWTRLEVASCNFCKQTK
jgi:hypothetical protein